MSMDPTYGRIDRDIQEAVDAMEPSGIGPRVAMENTLQARRDSGSPDCRYSPSGKHEMVHDRVVSECLWCMAVSV